MGEPPFVYGEDWRVDWPATREALLRSYDEARQRGELDSAQYAFLVGDVDNKIERLKAVVRSASR